jgi:hypothetical protein
MTIIGDGCLGIRITNESLVMAEEYTRHQYPEKMTAVGFARHQ